MEASKLKSVNSMLNIIGDNSLNLEGLQMRLQKTIVKCLESGINTNYLSFKGNMYGRKHNKVRGS